MKKLFQFFLILSVILLGIGFWGYSKIQSLINEPVNVQADQLLTLERGTTGQKLFTLLEQENIITNHPLFPWLLKLQTQLNNVKAGTYSLNGITTLGELLRLLNTGKEAQFSLRFTEGETWRQVKQSLLHAPHLTSELKDKTEEEIFTQFNALLPEWNAVNEWKTLDGWIYPDTYNYTPYSTDTALLKRAIEKMVKILNKAWQTRDEGLPLKNPYEMLILASIVEKESSIATERGKIASVFLNRLRVNMKLQTDPTVIYGMGENYTGNLRKKDLETPTPYNTYVIDGLPPTPIAMPSEESLMAVAKPEKTDFLYFVADGSGGHKFTRNLNEHNRAVQEYLRWLRQNKVQ
ncbi:endolytic transglycosylase MltG [Pasteurella bettyae]|uniref:Endolytic murein transglycosylase n=1 Tax=Pasteurella bettyae CCUG 2042 TaxID=1095749 RepID=I3DFB4_9PAST|nr:endolytic transglycosylase MltG [Pasteurella bettyae]EIJ70407.1 YceG family protein [Pasteurella bettyae CCUG 2042]SUB21041.1 putative aminodeoxychorismate lyase [Pasteurella bettyae]